MCVVQQVVAFGKVMYATVTVSRCVTPPRTIESFKVVESSEAPFSSPYQAVEPFINHVSAVQLQCTKMSNNHQFLDSFTQRCHYFYLFHNPQ